MQLISHQISGKPSYKAKGRLLIRHGVGAHAISHERQLHAKVIFQVF